MAVTQCADSFVVVVRCSSSLCVGMWVASAQRAKNAGHSRTTHSYNIIFFTDGPCDFCIREEAGILDLVLLVIPGKRPNMEGRLRSV